MDTAGLLTYAREFRETILQGCSSERMCVALSAPLHAVFRARGTESELVITDLGECEHVFLRLADGLVLDPTADQFNQLSREKLPGVYLGAPALIHQGAVPWPGGQEWHALMAELKRLYPDLRATEVGPTVSLTLRTLPAGLYEFTQATGPGVASI